MQIAKGIATAAAAALFLAAACGGSGSSAPPASAPAGSVAAGSCPAGSITAAGSTALQPLVAGASGNATATTMVPHDFVLPSEGWYANIHAGADLQGANAKSISCGNLPTS